MSGMYEEQALRMHETIAQRNGKNRFDEGRCIFEFDAVQYFLAIDLEKQLAETFVGKRTTHHFYTCKVKTYLLARMLKSRLDLIAEICSVKPGIQPGTNPIS